MGYEFLNQRSIGLAVLNLIIYVLVLINISCYVEKVCFERKNGVIVELKSYELCSGEKTLRVYNNTRDDSFIPGKCLIQE